MSKSKDANATLQRLVRGYLMKLSHIAKKHGLLPFVKETIKANRRGECAATRHEADMLARLVDDDRLFREEIPKTIGKSYRFCVENNIFNNIKKLKKKGDYSKIDTIMIKDKENG